MHIPSDAPLGQDRPLSRLAVIAFIAGLICGPTAMGIMLASSGYLRGAMSVRQGIAIFGPTLGASLFISSFALWNAHRCRNRVTGTGLAISGVILSIGWAFVLAVFTWVIAYMTSHGLR